MECSSEEEERQNTGRKSKEYCSSPEFEFWMVNNPSMPEPNLLTADELFSDGVLLPLHLLCSHPAPPPPPPPPPSSDHSPSILSMATSSSSSSPSSSKRWKDIFRVSDKKPDDKKDKKSGAGGGGTTELNIHIWPFSRSRSAGTASTGRAKPTSTARKSSSAPCSRSNSAGRKWTASPGRAAGVPVGRTSPVWQFRRPPSKVTEPKIKSGIRGLNLNVNTCIGYSRTQVSCRGDGKRRNTSGDEIKGDVSNTGSLFSLRTLFSKKVY
ncbi:Formin homology 2 domain (FH2 domain)-containing protein [Dioscorea alata]|uniref:Formin homology 2 domain (FH2 domain)-containing protein n=1 Tax=Dioscorea alata TaxID=55571 RepID=A0ACB7W6B2_DIOAL|nr:Formin homology 2 domain (FH2 domain)-containing protein [Dioscorea alata]